MNVVLTGSPLKSVCLESTQEIFTHIGDVTSTTEGLQILTYARHSFPWSNEGSLACYTHCDTGYPYIMIISDDPLNPMNNHIYCQAFNSGVVTSRFYDLDLSQLGFEHPAFRLWGQSSNALRHHRGFKI